ncbi:hypothetical protein H6F47_09115 [Sphaerospermopsis sp. FACHB-1094]|jgi:hypothetical protein|uniref:hypothetical protein n=1 Tax=Sphaerospermopsis sp. FACHB-1094 TaxID=2692861 RepID=UPI00168A1DDA|nr:hypothetical protein [Sphaerospermopsis sp. FACHB-1094]MBD2132582.1 hypothetical protein [Sphaerospermopsis sp. FACHB-1094]
MKPIVVNYNDSSRNQTLQLFEKTNRKLLRKIRSEKNYQTPKGYISWQQLSGIVGVALSTCTVECAGIDFSYFIHSHRMSLWFIQDAPIYCITPELFAAFDNTDVLHKPEVLAGWQPSLPTFLVTLPKGILESPSGELDYLVVHCASKEHPEWETGKWYDIEIPDLYVPDLHFDWSGTSTTETVWMSSSRVTENGDLVYNNQNNLGRNILDENDNKFVERVRNLVVNILLYLEYYPNTSTEISETEISTKAQGFTNITNPNIRRARWLGKGYQTKLDITNSGTHSSPHTHWRRGHWRILESGEGSRWKQSKRIWIEPTLVNG